MFRLSPRSSQKGKAGSAPRSTPDGTNVETPLINHGEIFDYGTNTIQGQSSTTSSPKDKPALFNRGLIMIYLNYASLCFLDMGYSALLPLFYSTSIPLGGLGLDPYNIGITLGTFGDRKSVV